MGVGVIGLGVGEQHALAFARHPDCYIAARCDLDAAKLGQASQRLPRARHYARAEDLIDDPDVQIVSVASNDDDHSGQIVRALDSGKHVFAEKPLCLHADELHRVVLAWRRARDLRLPTNTVLRPSPAFR